MENMISIASSAVHEVKDHWKTPAEGNYVSYKEAAALSVGHMGMRLARTFSLTQEDFVCNTLGMSQFQRVYMGYVTTAIDLGKNLLNGYILDNHRSPEGRFRCWVKLGIPAGILLLLALLFVPFDTLADANIWYMVAATYGIGQVQGYISGWFNTGVCGISQVITPNPKERTKVIAIEGIIHNVAPTITDIAVSMLLEKSYGFYDIRSFRIAYAPFIVLGTVLSLLSFYGTQERILLPKTRMTKIGFTDAFREVSRNKIFRIVLFDGWNDFLEDAKGNLLKYVYTYGKVAEGAKNVGLKYGLARDLVGSASFISMCLNPTVINLLGKGRFKFYKNIIQIFLIAGMGFAYKRSVPLLVFMLWLDKIVDTQSVIDSAIEADMKDYQHYLSGERIDGAFETVKLYMNTAVNSVTDLFIPWVKKKNGLTDNYDDFYNEDFRNKILDIMIKISVVGAVVDCVPYWFYDISEGQMDGISRVLKLRKAAEEQADGCTDEKLAAECGDIITKAKKYAGPEAGSPSRGGIRAARKLPKSERKTAVIEARKQYKEEKLAQREKEAAVIVLGELERYETALGKAEAEFSRILVNGEENEYIANAPAAKEYVASVLGSLGKKDGKELKRKLNELTRAEKAIARYYPDGLTAADPAALENAISLPENTREQRAFRSAQIRSAEKERSRYGKAAKPLLIARRTLTLEENYKSIRAEN